MNLSMDLERWSQLSFDRRELGRAWFREEGIDPMLTMAIEFAGGEANSVQVHQFTTWPPKFMGGSFETTTLIRSVSSAPPWTEW